MNLRFISASVLLALVASAAAQGPSEEALREEAMRQQARRQRLERIETTAQAGQEAWKKFLVSAGNDGVRLDCGKDQSGRLEAVLYRGYAFRVGANGALKDWGRYRAVDGVASWWEGDDLKWSLRLDDWQLQSVIAATQVRQPERCKKLGGDVGEITAPPPEFPQLK